MKQNTVFYIIFILDIFSFYWSHYSLSVTLEKLGNILTYWQFLLCHYSGISKGKKICILILGGGKRPQSSLKLVIQFLFLHNQHFAAAISDWVIRLYRFSYFSHSLLISIINRSPTILFILNCTASIRLLVFLMYLSPGVSFSISMSLLACHASGHKYRFTPRHIFPMKFTLQKLKTRH